MTASHILSFQVIYVKHDNIKCIKINVYNVLTVDKAAYVSRGCYISRRSDSFSVAAAVDFIKFKSVRPSLPVEINP